jgi:Regulator of ribonuclease activity B
MNTKPILSLLVAAALLIAASLTEAVAQTSQRMQLSQLEAMFSNMRAKAPWNVDGVLVWGFFFFDPSREKLKDAANELLAANYRVVTISEVPGRKTFRLHVEKIEVHSPASLHARNNELYELASKYKLASYDGMDVGPVPK